MIGLKQILEWHRIGVRGVVHVGAHDGNEHDEYLALGAQQVYFIEANPAVFTRLEQAMAGKPGVFLSCCAAGSVNGTAQFRITSSDQSSSVLPLKLHAAIYPEITETKQIAVPIRTLDSLMQERPSLKANLLVMDVQGYEGFVLEGAKETLKDMQAVLTEINFKELYAGCILAGELDSRLKAAGFRRVSTETPYRSEWGDALYVRSA